jgi:adenylate cyclase
VSDDGSPATGQRSGGGATEEQWRGILEGTAPGFAAGRGILRHLPSSPRCKLCLAPFSGLGGQMMRIVGRRPWAKNPKMCGLCFIQLENNHGGAEIDASLLFADIRGSTGLAETMGTERFRTLMDRFYHAVTEVLIEHDGIVDKFVGDEVVALFIPALTGADHAKRAIASAQGILAATGHGSPEGPWAPIGVGVHTGRTFVGTIGDTVTDFTALGDPVNVTARLASEAAAGEILVTRAASGAAGATTAGLEHRSLTLRGRQEPLDVHVFHV